MPPPQCLIYTSFVGVFAHMWVGECMFFLKFYLEVKLKICALVPSRNAAEFLREIGKLRAGPAGAKAKQLLGFNSIRIFPSLHWKY